jgi:hypothetical protein
MHSALTAQLEAAVLQLIGNGTLKDRLYSAWCHHLDGIAVSELPEETQQEFAAMIAVMHGARALPGDSVVRASIRKFSAAEAERYAALVLRVWRLRVQQLALPAVVQRAPVRSASREAREARESPEATPLAALLALESGTRVRSRARQAGRN